jgi:hypothetical protein
VLYRAAGKGIESLEVQRLIDDALDGQGMVTDERVTTFRALGRPQDIDWARHK